MNCFLFFRTFIQRISKRKSSDPVEIFIGDPNVFIFIRELRYDWWIENEPWKKHESPIWKVLSKFGSLKAI